MLCLTLRERSSIPIEVDGVLPERVANKSIDDIRRIPVLRGNRSVPLEDLFELTVCDGSDDLAFAGETETVKHIGTHMTSGSIRVFGNAGMHAGAKMSGGSLTINGRAGDWLGAEMSGGRITVHGDAGHAVGAGYRGCRRGMTGGTIHIAGHVGDELGAHLRRGLIVVNGSAGLYAGTNMIAGTIVIGEEAGPGLGVGMKRGTIVLERGSVIPHPGLVFGGVFEPAYLRFLANQLSTEFQRQFDWGVQPAHCWRSDRNVGGQGELWLVGN